MFVWLTADENDAISMLKHDHDTVKDLFERFEKAERKADKHRIVKQALEELRIHAALEEEIFYPAVREQLRNGVMNEADEEHHVAKILVAELDAGNPDSDHYDAKFIVLAESVRHHIKEEENEMLPKARDLDIDFKALGQKMAKRKQELKAKGVPATAEDTMISKQRTSPDSPARAAHRKKSPARAVKARVPAKRSANSRQS